MTGTILPLGVTAPGRPGQVSLLVGQLRALINQARNAEVCGAAMGAVYVTMILAHPDGDKDDALHFPHTRVPVMGWSIRHSRPVVMQ
jgi:hypothetical protein